MGEGDQFGRGGGMRDIVTVVQRRRAGPRRRGCEVLTGRVGGVRDVSNQIKMPEFSGMRACAGEEEAVIEMHMYRRRVERDATVSIAKLPHG